MRSIYHLYQRLFYQKVFGHIEVLNDSESWSRDDIAQYQSERLRLIYDRLSHSPFWRDRLKSNLISGLDLGSLGTFPILTKRDIQIHGRRMLTIDPSSRGVLANQTGGSTGEPVHFWQDQSYKDSKQAALMYAFELCGYHRGDKQLFIWGSDFDSKQHDTIAGKFFDWLNNAKFVNAFNLNEGSISDTVELTELWRPSFIWGYVSSLTLLAQAVKKAGIDISGIKAIQSTAEVLQSDQRKLIESQFNAPVFNRYGCRELSVIAHECESHQGLHILSANHIVEVVGGDGKPARVGELGRLIVTNLHNLAMPFIRYDTGDLAILDSGQCACGRTTARLTSIVGRQTDIIYSPSGKMIHGEFFTHLFYKIKGVEQFQVGQVEQDSLIIKIVRSAEFSQASVEFLKKVIQEHGDPRFKIKFEFPDRIELSKSGKFRFTFSNIKHPLSS